MKRLMVVLFCIILMAMSACGNKNEPAVQENEKEEMKENDTEMEEGVAVDDEDLPEESEQQKNPDELEYVSCTVDELVTEMFADIDAVSAKYTGKYMEITGILKEASVDDTVDPPGKIVRMTTSVEPPEENGVAMVVAYSLDEEWMSQDEYTEIIKDMQAGDEVLLRAYVNDFSFRNDGGNLWCQLELIDVRK